MARYTKEEFVREKFDEKITNEWDIFSLSSIFNKEYIEEEAKEEIILSYANALNCIAQSLLKQNHAPITIMTFRRNSLTIPFVFLARHTVELTLKYICDLVNIRYEPKHGLLILWDKFIQKANGDEIIQDEDLNDIRVFIGVMEELDCDGSHSRYSKDNKGKLYNDKAKFINVKNINDFIQGVFVKFINTIKPV